MNKSTYKLGKCFYLINILFTFFLTANISIYSQGQPVIQAPAINNSICAGTTANIVFTTVDGNGANANNGKGFTTNTSYRVYTTNNAEFTVVSSSTANNYSTSSEIVTLSIQIPNNYTPALYQIRIESNQPDVVSEPSNQFEIKAKPLAPTANSNSPVCSGGIINLTASTITGASYEWTGPNGFTSSTQNPIITNSTVAMSGIYRVKAIVNSCSSNLGTTTVVVNANPSINSTTPRSRCGAGSVILSATASTGILKWYSVASGGSILGTGSNFTTPNISTSTTYYVDATSNGCISGSRTAVLATVNTIPTITGTTPGSRCGTGTVVLGATASIGTINWYVAANGGASLGTGTTFTTPSITSNTTYYVDAISNGCTTGSRSAVLAKVNPIPTITSSTPRSRCGTGTVVLGATASTGTINWYAAATGGASLGTGTTFTTPNISSNTTYYVDATSIGCISSSRSAVLATVNTIPTAPIVSSNSPVCIGGTIDLTSSFISDATYSWTGPNGFTSNSQNPSLANANALIAGNYMVTVTVDGCTSIEANTDVVVNNTFNWTGATSTDWNTASNWSCNTVPSLQTNVIINSGLTNYPVLNSGANGMAKDLELQIGTSLTVMDNTMRIAGSITNTGTINSLSGTIAMEGVNSQTIPANTFVSNRIRNLIINNNAGVNSNNALEITGFLRAENGQFNTGNLLSLISNSTQTALIDGSGNGQIVGSVKMQRYLDSAIGYKYFSSPFNNTTVGDFSSYVDLNATFPQVYSYSEDNTDGSGNDITGWKSYNNSTFGLGVLEGYAFNFGTAGLEVTVELNGIVNNGNFQRQLKNTNGTYTDGYNLVGNPYPSPIDWDASSWTKTNIDDGIYFFSANSQYKGTYTSYVNNVSSDDGGSSNIIPSMQGFFVHVSDGGDDSSETSGILASTNEVRVNNFTQQFIKKTEPNPISLIRLSAGIKDNLAKDAMVIYFDSYAKEGFEKDMDALKLMNTDERVPNLYSISSKSVKLSINALPASFKTANQRIPLGIRSEMDGEMSIRLKNIENLPSNFFVYLIDDVKRIGQNLSEIPEYNFRIKAGEHNSRFFLIFSEYELTDPALAFDEPFSIETLNGKVYVNLNLENGMSGVLMATTVTGQILDIKKVSGNETISLDGIKSSGLYFINLSWEGQKFSKKIIIQK
ncbi:T9SS type A sorting domain-containing protein [Gillisia sp. CAL575]|uniref:Ig-like domain-containing protein n=1 Tax=Gillisia sp. CAL575 TaxID=985255 RepID=UPI0018DD762E|nr:T9SS type A sorting domain-containing protein [Gillisia sp. CAL575]